MNYDLIIIGSGSAWLPAGMYASRYKIKNLIIWEMPGWALATSHQVENYPWVSSDSGKNIMDSFAEHAKTSGSEILQDKVTSVEKTNEGFIVKTAKWEEFTSRFVLMATWNEYRKLGVPGEKELLWRGVSYCATCDWMFFKNREVIIVWGWDAALTESLYLSEICSKVHILYRWETLRAEKIWVEKAKERENIEIHYNTEVEEIVWGVLGMTHVNLKWGWELKADGIFIAIGSDPFTALVDHMNPEKDDSGCLVVDKRQETNIPGLYAAGDITTNSNKFKQTIMSAAEGCLAANSIHEDIIKG